MFSLSRRTVFHVLKANKTLLICVLRCQAHSVNSGHLCSTFIKADLSDTQAVTTGRHGDVVVCWHPERKFPYEHSKPIPRSEDTLVTGEAESKLKHMEANDPQGPSNYELNQMFHVTKHTWRHRPQLNRAKKSTSVERKAL